MCDNFMPFARVKAQCNKPRRQRAVLANGSADPSERVRHEKAQYPYLIPVEDTEEFGFPARTPTISCAQSSYLLPVAELDEPISPVRATTHPNTNSRKQTAMQSSLAISPRAVLLSTIPTAGRGKSPQKRKKNTIPRDQLSQPMPVPTVDPRDRFKLPEAVTIAADIARQAAVECSSAWGAMLRAKFDDLAGYKVEGGCAAPQESVGACSSARSADGASGKMQELDEPVDEVSPCDASFVSLAACSDMSSWVMEPPQGACSWDWPLSRSEAKERVAMFGQFELMAEVEDLRTRVSNNGTEPRPSC